MKYATALMALLLSSIFMMGCQSNDSKSQDLGEEVDEALHRAGKAIKEGANDMGDIIQDACDEATDENC